MSFNKSKSMRNAERYLTNGRIEAAIGEYKLIVQNDPGDITTQNMLGDLYVKALKTGPAVACYKKVADHYHKQGFAKKAIAVYNKIYKLDPNSTEIVGKLGELYHLRGSVAEARAHYKIYADRLEKEGRAPEVLDVWHKLAELDRHDPDICLKIAEAENSKNRKDEACKAYFEAGTRLVERGEHENAIESFEKALSLNERFGKAVRGIVRARILLGKPEEAASFLEEKLEEDPYNKDLIFLLIDCYFERKDAAGAEKVITKLVEREPANYPKLLELVSVYLESGDAESAIRVLSMTSEHLLAGGDAETLEEHLDSVLKVDPKNIEGLRLLARCYGWRRKQVRLRETLLEMIDAASEAERHSDERWALSQYLVLVPHDSGRKSRFEYLVGEFGPEDTSGEELLAKEQSDPVSEEEAGEYGLESEAQFAAVNEAGSGLIAGEKDVPEGLVPATVVEDPTLVSVVGEGDVFSRNGAQQNMNGSDSFVKTPLNPTDEVRLDEEIESIRFYIEQSYTSLADKALKALENEFGRRKEIVELRAELGYADEAANDVSRFEESTARSPSPSKPLQEGDTEASFAADESPTTKEAVSDPVEEIVTELGLNETETSDPEQFEDHYNRGVVYKEMGMIEEAIREFQDAAECVSGEDQSRRYYNCCTLLGHCFVEQGMPNLALIWFEKACESSDLSPEERQALDYELGVVLELSDRHEEAIAHFERVYAEDVDYRDVASRLESLRSREPVAG
ncbi:MAG: tetratricopeptide repeat protein [Acidobacteriota bacterium]|nr:MAG: tetratricopeptide repeat protein [Acidobacteriota bacterium]